MTREGRCRAIGIHIADKQRQQLGHRLYCVRWRVVSQAFGGQVGVTRSTHTLVRMAAYAMAPAASISGLTTRHRAWKSGQSRPPANAAGSPVPG
jgi:hypothetical protein